MKENVRDFLEKVTSSAELTEKMVKLEQSYIEQVVALAREAGFELTEDNFTEVSKVLSDEQMKNVSAGYIPAPTGYYWK